MNFNMVETSDFRLKTLYQKLHLVKHKLLQPIKRRRLWEEATETLAVI
jgi:hypothetical protein